MIRSINKRKLINKKNAGLKKKIEQKINQFINSCKD